jgi:hypothetical protein
MTFLTSSFHLITLGLSAFILGAAVLLFFRRKTAGGEDKATLGLQHLVTLNSGGWLILSIVAAAGATVMFGSSIAIGIDYWTGLAINADVTGGRIDPKGGALNFVTVGVVSFCVLAIFFELMSDTGTPLSSGFRQRKNHALANFVIIATVGCVFMSLITKWGYYDDKANVRRVEGAKVTVEDQNYTAAKTEAEAVILALKGTPSSAVADAKAASATAKIASLKSELEDAKAARQAIPESHSTNRIQAGREVSRLSGLLLAAQEEGVAVAVMRDNIKALADAEAALAAANAAIEDNAGLVGSSNGGGHEKAGDWFAVRLIRVGLHQFLCWLFPLVFFESLAATGDAKRKERANKARSQTLKDKANTIDVEPTDPRAATPGDPLQLTAAGFWQEEQEREANERAELERRKRKRRGAGTPVAPGYSNGSGEDVPELPANEEGDPELPGDEGALDDA